MRRIKITQAAAHFLSQIVIPICVGDPFDDCQTLANATITFSLIDILPSTYGTPELEATLSFASGEVHVGCKSFFTGLQLRALYEYLSNHGTQGRESCFFEDIDHKWILIFSESDREGLILSGELAICGLIPKVGSDIRHNRDKSELLNSQASTSESSGVRLTFSQALIEQEDVAKITHQMAEWLVKVGC